MPPPPLYLMSSYSSVRDRHRKFHKDARAGERQKDVTLVFEYQRRLLEGKNAVAPWSPAPGVMPVTRLQYVAKIIDVTALMRL